MRIKWGQDLATGVMFILIGLGSIFTIYAYDKLSMGTPQRPGTGVLPLILAWCLIATGGVLSFKAVVAGDEPMSRWAWRPLFALTAATIAFGLLIDELGLIVTMIVSLTLCALGTLETRWREFAVFLAIMIAIGVGTFIWLLGMPVATWPTGAPNFLNFIFR